MLCVILYFTTLQPAARISNPAMVIREEQREARCHTIRWPAPFTSAQPPASPHWTQDKCSSLPWFLRCNPVWPLASLPAFSLASSPSLILSNVVLFPFLEHSSFGPELAVLLYLLLNFTWNATFSQEAVMIMWPSVMQPGLILVMAPPRTFCLLSVLLLYKKKVESLVYASCPSSVYFWVSLRSFQRFMRPEIIS